MVLSRFGACLSEVNGNTNVPTLVTDSAAWYLPGQVYNADDQCYIGGVGVAACPDVSILCCNLYYIGDNKLLAVWRGGCGLGELYMYIQLPHKHCVNFMTSR